MYRQSNYYWAWNYKLFERIWWSIVHEQVSGMPMVTLPSGSFWATSSKLPVFCRSTIYLRGSGGFSSSSHPYSYKTYPDNQILHVSVPKHQPTVVYEDTIQQSQVCYFDQQIDYCMSHCTNVDFSNTWDILLMHRFSWEFEIADYVYGILHMLICSVFFIVFMHTAFRFS